MGASASSPRRCGRRRPPTAGEQLAGSDFPAQLDSALETLSVIEAANAEEEALAIAVALREAVETPGKTAALVTPDRALARRVLAALERWKVAVDDSGGDALADTPAGVFARLAAEAALGGVRAGDACSPCSSIRCTGSAPPQARMRAPSRRWNRRCCAARARGRAPRASSARSPTFRAELAKLRRGEPSDLHRVRSARRPRRDAELERRRRPRRPAGAALAPLEPLAGRMSVRRDRGAPPRADRAR